MPPKKKHTKKKVHQPGPFAIAMNNLSHVADMGRASDAAYMAGREREAEDAHDGTGYKIDLTEPGKIPEYKGGILTTPKRKHSKRIAGVTPAHLSYRANPDIAYEMKHHRRTIGNVHGKLEAWAEPVFDAARSLPTGESRTVDYGPPTNPREFRAVISHVAL